MKKAILFFVFLALTVFFFTSCNKKDQNPYVINVDVENGSEYDADSIIIKIYPAHEFYGQNMIIARKAYNNGKFSFTLPDTLEEKYLEKPASRIGMSEKHDYIKISDPEARLSSFVNMEAYKEGKYWGVISPIPVDDSEDNSFARYWYADRPFTLNAKSITPFFDTIVCNVTFKKGWNIVLITGNDKGEHSKTNIISDVPKDLKWTY